MHASNLKILKRFSNNTDKSEGFTSCGDKGFMTTREIAGKVITEAETIARTNEVISYITGILRKAFRL